jgi:hypothetical protein
MESKTQKNMFEVERLAPISKFFGMFPNPKRLQSYILSSIQIYTKILKIIQKCGKSQKDWNPRVIFPL